MKKLLKMIALVLGIGQSTAHINYEENFKNGTFMNNERVYFIKGVGYKKSDRINDLSKKEFIGHMMANGIICL